MNTIKTYKPNSHFKTITFEMIEKLQMLNLPINKKFDYCKRSIAQAIVNPLKVSYIKKEKRKSLKEHAKVILPLSPTPEQRNKYYNSCSLEKFANNIFNKKNITAEQLKSFNEIVKQAKEKANLTLTKELKTFDAHEIPNIYHINNGSDSEQYKGYHITENSGINSSCMQGKPKKYFEIYTDIEEGQAVEMATLIQGNEIVARALVWFDVPADTIGKDVIKPQNVYIDRIYTKTQEHRAETQTQLYFDILKHYKIKTEEKIISAPIPLQVLSQMNDKNKELGKTKSELILPNCYNRNNILDKVKSRLNTTKEIKLNSYPRFDVETNLCGYDYYPYCDSLQYYNTCDGKLSADEQHDSDILKLDKINGEAHEMLRTCEHCGNDMQEDEMYFIETEGVEVCEHCATYCEERDEYILTDDAVYNNNTGQYLYRGDLDL